MSEEPTEAPAAEPANPIAPLAENAGRDARAQAAEYVVDYFASTPLTLDDGTVIHVPPDPRLRLLDDDQQAVYDALLLESESFDRGPDIVIPPQQVRDKEGNLVNTLPEQRQPGPLLVPYRKTDENGVTRPIAPSWEMRVVKAALGDEDYAKLRAGTINGVRGASRHIQQIWMEQNLKLEERRAADPKSAGSTGDSAPVSAPDPQGPGPVPPAQDS